MNYFDIFNIPQSFRIDEKKLTEKFYQLQKIYHPDMNSNNIFKKKKSFFSSSNINKGYLILKKKLTRAQYLLNLNNINTSSLEKTLCNDKKILEKQFSLYEKIEKIKTEPFFSKKISILKKKIQNKKKYYFKKIEKEFFLKNIEKAAKIFLKLSFIEKILFEIKKTEMLFLKKYIKN